MVSDAEKPQSLRRFIHKVPALGSTFGMIGRLELDWRVGWFVPAGILAFIVFYMMASINTPAAFFFSAGVIGIAIVFLRSRSSRRKPLLSVGYLSAARLGRKLSGVSLFVSDQALIGTQPNGVSTRPKELKIFGRVEILAHKLATGPKQRAKVIGMVSDSRYRSWTVCLGVDMSSMFSDNPAARIARMRGWTDLLDNLAERETLYRFSVKIQSIGEHVDPEGLLQYMRDSVGLTPPENGMDNRFIEGLLKMADGSMTQRVILLFTFHDKKLKYEAQRLGSEQAAVENELEALYSLVMGETGDNSPIGATGAAWLSYNQVLLFNRMLLDPVIGQPLLTEWLGAKRRDTNLINPTLGWPYSHQFDKDMEFAPKHPDWGRLGDTYLRTYFADGFNKRGMSDDVLWPIISVKIPKTITLIFQMLPYDEAIGRLEIRAKNVEEDATSGWRQTEAQTEAVRRAQQAEREAAQGQGEHGRCQMFVTIYGVAPAEIDANALKLEKGWTKSRIALIPMTDDQARGAETLLPAGRGLPDIVVK